MGYLHSLDSDIHRYGVSDRVARRPQPSLEGSMPTYEYRCRDCQNVFDRVEPLAEHGGKVPSCPKCKSRNVEQVMTPFFAKTSHKA
jgi:putative FmdB family regulatory protein